MPNSMLFPVILSASNPPIEYPQAIDARLIRSTAVSIWYKSCPLRILLINASADGRYRLGSLPHSLYISRVACIDGIVLIVLVVYHCL